MADLYKEAVAWGLEKAKEELAGTHFSPGGPKFQETAQYWAAWWAGRRASDALLDEARKVGVTDAQWEALRAKAAEVAYD